MSPGALVCTLRAVAAAGGYLRVEAGEVRVRAPAPLPPALLGSLRRYRDVLAQFLDRPLLPDGRTFWTLPPA